MDHAMRMQILQRRYQLTYIALRLQLRQSLPSSQQLVQRLILTHLQQYVDILIILEEMFKGHNIRVVQ